MAVLEAVTAGWTVRVLIRQLFRKGSGLLFHSTCLALNDANFWNAKEACKVYWNVQPGQQFSILAHHVRSRSKAFKDQHSQVLISSIGCAFGLHVPCSCCQIAGSSTESLNLFSLSFAGPLTYFDIANIGNPCLTSLLMYFVG